ncbi:hypothetical protein MY11210_003781 [Beauveria gryllotalpidicola]
MQIIKSIIAVATLVAPVVMAVNIGDGCNRNIEKDYTTCDNGRNNIIYCDPELYKALSYIHHGVEINHCLGAAACWRRLPPRGIEFDKDGGLLVIDAGAGLVHLSLKDDGNMCVSVDSKSTLLASKEARLRAGCRPLNAV